jgi:hypothetical protein
LPPPITTISLPTSGAPPPWVQLEPTDVPGAYRLVEGNPSGLRIQDVGSQAIVPLLELQPGQRFLDLCAAPGNKTVSTWPQLMVFPAGKRYFVSMDRIDSVINVAGHRISTLSFLSSWTRETHSFVCTLLPLQKESQFRLSTLPIQF